MTNSSRLLASLLLIALGCRPPVTIDRPVQGIRPVGCRPSECGDSSHTVSITFLGVSGLLIEHDGHILLTAPFFSNPSLGQVRPRVTKLLRSSPRIAPDTALIERFLPRQADRATTILVGHGHYDHLMDVPYIAAHRATSATIYGSPTVRHMLMGDSTLRASGGTRVVVIPATAIGTPQKQGVWYYSADSAYRFMALLASHAPTYRAWRQTYTFTSGTVDTDLDSLPHTAAEWKLGEPYSYVIDVLSADTRRTVFRIYFQDAPSEPPLGFPPPELLTEHPIDLAVLCAATSTNVSNTPDSLLTVLKPRHVILAHWEDFFRPQSLPLQLGPATDLEALRKSLDKTLPPSSDWVMPLPQTTFRFRESPPDS